MPAETGQSEPIDVEQADLDGDGFWDAAVLASPAGQGYLQFLYGTGRGVLAGPPLPLEKQGESLLVPFAAGFGIGDFNEDGRPDLAVAQRTKAGGLSDGIYCGATPGAMIFLGGGGVFEFSTCLTGLATGHNLTDAVTGDFDGDGHVDVVIAASNVSGLRTYLGNGDATFDAPLNSAALAMFGPLTAIDVDADGDLDVAGRSSLTGGVRIALNDGAGAFAFSPVGAATPLFSVTSIPSFALGFVNDDAIPDLAGVVRGRLSSASDPVQDFTFVSLGAVSGGALSYTAGGHQLLGDGTAGTVLIADFDKDLAGDIVVTYDGAAPIQDAAHVYRGNGDGTFGSVSILGAGQMLEPRLAVIGDWNEDHWLDLAVTDRNQGNESRTWILQQSPGLADAAGPAVAISTPVPGETVNGVVTIAVDATDPSGVDRVAVFGGAALIGTARTAGADGKYRVTWLTTNGPNGSVVLSARAWDMNGSYATATGVPVVVNNADVTPPAVSIVADPVRSWTGASPGQVALSAVASDVSGVTNVEFYYQQAGSPLIMLGSDDTSPFGLTWNTGEDANSNGILDPGEDGNGNGVLDVVLVPAGTYSIIARAYDAATPQNTGESLPIEVIVDRPPTADAGPDRTLTATSVAGATLTLEGSGSDPDAVTGDTLTFEWFDEFGSPIGGARPTGSLPIPDPVPPGQYLFLLRVTDNYGVVAEDSMTVTVQEGIAVIVAVAPNGGQQGQQLAVVLAGQFTHWEQDSTTASFGSGIDVLGVTVTSQTSATAHIAIDTVATTGPRSITVTTGTEVVALADAFSVMEKVTYPLTIAPTGSGSGTVTSTPAGIACGIDCTEAFDAGTTVTLTAVADSNSVFTGWSGGACAGTGPCTLTMAAATTITATFTTDVMVPLAPPGPLTASSPARTRVSLTWTDNSSDENLFLIERSSDDGARWKQIAARPANATQYTDEDVKCGRSYLYRVRAYRNQDGLFSPFSNIVVARTSPCGKGTRSVRPRILEAELPDVILVGQPFRYQFSATGTSPLTWSLDHAPESMSIDEHTGVLSWTPTLAQAGRHRFVVRVSNAAGSVRASYRVRVAE